jgi:hypothetical protein
MDSFDIIWKFAVIGLLLGINLSLGMMKFKLDSVESLLTVPEAELPVYDEDGQGE